MMISGTLSSSEETGALRRASTTLRAPHYVHLSINAATASPSSGRVLVDPLYPLCKRHSAANGGVFVRGAAT